MLRRSDSARGFLQTGRARLRASCATMPLSDTGAASVVTLAVNATDAAAVVVEAWAAGQTQRMRPEQGRTEIAYMDW